MSKKSFILTFIIYLLLQNINLFSAHKNVLVFPENVSPNEPSICIDPKHPERLLAGSNLYWYAVSGDTGRTWKYASLSSPYGVWGDPVIAVDTNSNFYFLHLSGNGALPNWLDRIVCQKYDQAKSTWNSGSFTEVNGKEHDKQWVAIDRNKNIMYMTWTEFDNYGTYNPKDSSRIKFSKSTDEGETWSKSKVINDKNGDCRDDDNTPEGAVPAVGPNGEIYVAWSAIDGIMFDKSTDGGTSWLPNDMIVASQPGGWNYVIPGIMRCNGLPVIQCDLSGGKYNGTLYINWSDQRNGSDDTDIWLIKSTDNGKTWSQPIRVNDDPPGRQQFFTWMSIDQTNGYLYFVFYDRRNHTDIGTDVYMAVSKDGAKTFINKKISQSPFYPESQVFFGDYTNITAHNNIIRPIWARMDNGMTQVWTALIDIDSLLLDVPQYRDVFRSQEIELEQNYPNPFRQITYIPFKLALPAIITLELYDSQGSLINQIVNQKHYDEGKYTLNIDAVSLNLNQGVYYYILKSENKTLSKKLIIIK